MPKPFRLFNLIIRLVLRSAQKNDFTGHVSVNIKMNQYGVPTSMDVDIYDDEDGSLVYSEECALLGGTILDTITQCVEVIDLVTSTPLYELKEAQEQL